MAAKDAERKFDIVVFGATSSVGVEVVKYLAAHAGSFRWCIAGRSAKALEPIARETAMRAGCPAPDIVIADVGDPATLRAMAKQASVVLTTVGPYTKFGEPVIEACIAEGTDYADITGETPWVNKMKKKHGAAATKAGVRILSFCGYDCIPSELSVYLAAKELKSYGGPALVESFHCIAGGGLPAGTVETILHGVAEGFQSVKDKVMGGKRQIQKLDWTDNPGIVPASEKEAFLRSMPSLWSIVSWSSQAKAFTPVHFMAPVNTYVVHSSASALGYGGLRYNERLTFAALKWHQSFFTMFGLLPTVVSLLSLAFLGLCAVLGVLRTVAKAINLFASQQSPNTHVTTIATSRDGKARATITMQYPGDPGIMFTTVLCVETALGLAEGKGIVGGPGFSTPSVTMADTLLSRLKKAGVTVAVKTDKL